MSNQALPERLIAALAGRYRLERELGAGGMATVYLAEDLRHHRKVAVKVLRPELAATMGADRFDREIEVAARLVHPHILGLIDSGDAGGFFYYVMPYVEGETLRDRLARSGEMPVHEAVRLLGEIADALAVAHKAGVVHRDIKPENILLSGRHAMVMDFGVAKAVTEASGRQQLTTAGVALGTPAYMAPEQATADPLLDGRLDIYALGVVAYEMLTGYPPFHGLNPQQTLAAHVTQTPVAVGQRRPGLSPALEGVVMRCLQKRPADRFQSADELVATLEPLATPSGGMTPTHTQPLAAVVPTAPTARARGIVLGIVALAVVAGAIYLARVGAREESLTLARTRRLTSAPGREILPAFSPDGQFLAYVATGAGRAANIFLQPADGGRAVNLTDSFPGSQISPDWSPDGRRLAFVSFDSLGPSIAVMPPTGGDARRIYRVPYGDFGADFPRAPKWSPDGSRIVFEQGDSILIIGADGSGLRLVGLVRAVHSLAWSPDGRWLAGVRGNLEFVYGGSSFGNLAASTVFVLPAAGGTPTMVSDSTTLNVSPVWLTDGRGLLYVSSGGGGRDIYRQRISGGKPEGAPSRITTGLDAHTIALSRDGKHLAYSKYSRDLNVWMVRIPPTGSARASDAVPITRGNQASEVVRLSPDGKWLAYDSDLNGNADIFIVPSDGGAPRQLTDDPSDDLAVDWSPDGSQLAFHSFRTGNREVFTIGADGTGLAQVTHDTLDDWYAVWGPDDNTLAFTRGKRPNAALLEVRRPTSSAPWGPPLRLASGIANGVTADRSAYAYFQDDAAAALVPSGGGTPTIVFRPPDWFSPNWVRMGPDGHTLYTSSPDSARDPAYWAIDIRTGALRKVVTFDHGDTRTVRGVFDTDGHRFYFVAGEHQSDIWVAEVATR